MNRAEAKKWVIGHVAADLSATLGAGLWGDQGLLEGLSDGDLVRIDKAADEFLAELHRRADNGSEVAR